ncbi:MAG: hypothetical protein Q9162_007471 [Coniocarpon cinnabarinum]
MHSLSLLAPNEHAVDTEYTLSHISSSSVDDHPLDSGDVLFRPDLLDLASTSPAEDDKDDDDEEIVQDGTATTPMEHDDTTPAPTRPVTSWPAQTLSKAIVMARLNNEDTSWVHSELSDWDAYIYHPLPNNTHRTTKHAPTIANSRPHDPLQLPRKGRETLAYLTYITQYYDTLPDIMTFLHPHRDGYPRAWHTDAANYSNVASLRSLRLDYVQERGYVNLRCNPAVGCAPPEIQLNRSIQDPDRSTERVFPEAWNELFGAVPFPEVVGAACCAQFAVSRERVWERSWDEYERYRQWVLKTELSDDIAGRVMEYLWHIIFGMEAVDCPNMGECYCNVYGRGCPSRVEATRVIRR